MLNIPSSLRAQFEAYLQEKAIPKNNQAAYQKWLRYYLDFCRKYNFPQTQCGSLTHFFVKLQEKKQTKAQQDQASHSISLYYELILANDGIFAKWSDKILCGILNLFAILSWGISSRFMRNILRSSSIWVAALRSAIYASTACLERPIACPISKDVKRGLFSYARRAVVTDDFSLFK